MLIILIVNYKPTEIKQDQKGGLVIVISNIYQVPILNSKIVH